MNTLQDIESILRDSSGTFQFSHPSFQEILAAKQFADEINSGTLNIENAWLNCWSYEINRELWNLDCNRTWLTLKPAMRKIVAYVMSKTSVENKVRIERVILSSYRKFQQMLDRRYKRDNLDIEFGIKRSVYNPFMHDAAFSLNNDETSDAERDLFHECCEAEYPSSAMGVEDKKEEFEPSLEDMMFIRPDDELIGTIKLRENSLDLKLAALSTLERRTEINTKEDLLSLYTSIENNQEDILLKVRILNLLSIHHIISDEEYTNELIKHAHCFFLKRSRVRSIFTGYLGIPFEHWENDIRNDEILGSFTKLSNKTVEILGERIRRNIPGSSKLDKIGYIQLLGFIKDKNSGAFLVNQLIERSNQDYEDWLEDFNMSYNFRYEIYRAIAFIQYEGVINYACEVLDERLKDYESEEMKILKMQYEKEKRNYVKEVKKRRYESIDAEMECLMIEADKEEGGDVLEGLIIPTQTYKKINEIEEEINTLIEILGYLKSPRIIPLLEKSAEYYHNEYNGHKKEAKAQREKYYVIKKDMLLSALTYIKDEKCLDIMLMLYNPKPEEMDYDFIDAIEKVVYSEEGFNKVVRFALKDKKTYEGMSCILQRLHEKFMPTGYIVRPDQYKTDRQLLFNLA